MLDLFSIEYCAFIPDGALLSSAKTAFRILVAILDPPHARTVMPKVV